MNDLPTAPFQVDLRGVVDLLSRSIYSTPRVYLRELLQNGRDAIVARAVHEQAEPDWGIRVVPLTAPSGTFEIHDDGVGLTVAEVRDLLATVGRSSKRDLLDLPRDDYLGQFGIGLLSCFMVSDVITIHSQSATGGPAVEWVGYADGRYSLQELPQARPVGTSVYLRPRADYAAFLQAEAVVEDARRFGEFLPTPIRVDLDRADSLVINREPAFLDIADEPSPAALAFGARFLGDEPLDAIAIDVPATGTRGVAYIVPRSPAPGARQASKVYLGGMLLGDAVDGLLPDWAFFVRLVVSSTGLHPTASREDVVNDDALSETREAIAAQMREWILETSVRQPHRLHALIAAHGRALKALAIHDEDLVRYVAPHLVVETSRGDMTLADLASHADTIRYAPTVDEFRQLLPVLSDDDVIVNGGYAYDTELVEAFARTVGTVKAMTVDAVSEIRALAAPPLDDRDMTSSLAARASTALEDVGVEVVVRSVANPGVSSLYVVNPQILRSIDRGHVREAADPLWAGILDSVDEALVSRREEGAPHQPTLLINWGSPLIRAVAQVNDAVVFDRALRVLYVQALMAGHHPLTPQAREIMTQAFGDLLALSVATNDVTGGQVG